MTTAPRPRVDAIGLVVSDVPAAVAFYRRLGLDLPDPPPGEDHVEADLGGGVRLMLDSEPLMRSLWPQRSFSPDGRLGLAVALPDDAALDALYAELDADGAGVEAPHDAPWGQRYATVRDPDGTPVDLYAPLSAPAGPAPG